MKVNLMGNGNGMNEQAGSERDEEKKCSRNVTSAMSREFLKCKKKLEARKEIFCGTGTISFSIFESNDMGRRSILQRFRNFHERLIIIITHVERLRSLRKVQAQLQHSSALPKRRNPVNILLDPRRNFFHSISGRMLSSVAVFCGAQDEI